MEKNKLNHVYYIGFNANNAICNDKFFSGSITLYPTGENGNVFYSNNKIIDRNRIDFEDKYTQYIYKNIKKLQSLNECTEFMFFNEKIKKMCSKIKDVNFVRDNNYELTKFLNDKFKIRNYFKNKIPILDYEYCINNDSCTYYDLTLKMNCKKFVFQEEFGSGGDATILISNESDYKTLLQNDKKYCISKYIKNTPLNITLIIGKNNIVIFPISAQLIKIIDNKFKYVGADFAYANSLQDNIISEIYDYSNIIAKELQNKEYRGILGIDYILTNEDKVYFMEINPRFQSSSFLLSIILNKSYNTSIAELNYLALNDKNIPEINLNEIKISFLNCNDIQPFDNYKEDYKIVNGYFPMNSSSYYRKVFNKSIINPVDFEMIDD